jgi:two-component system sensor histidine kinase/response regulator
MTEPIQSLKILIVEDDDISQFLISKMIMDLGHQYTIASNGVEALEVLEKDIFDLILMDIEMPVISGYETTRRIRSSNNSELSRIPIIGISANPLENDVKPFLDKGMNDYISKPIHELELKQKIDNQLIK